MERVRLRAQGARAKAQGSLPARFSWQYTSVVNLTLSCRRHIRQHEHIKQNQNTKYNSLVDTIRNIDYSIDDFRH